MRIIRQNIFMNRMIIGIVCVVILLITMSGTWMSVSAAEEKPLVDMDQEVEISILLEDESRFMEVDLYLIGEYKEDEFRYLPAYRELVDKDYYALDTDRQRDESVETIAAYIKGGNDIMPDVNLQITNGVGKTNEIPLGLYLIIQNDGNHNSELDKNIIVEAPLYDEEQNIYLYDISLYPKWERSIWFSFRPEVIYPLEIILLLGICTLLCIFSTRLVRSLCFFATFLLAGLVGMQVGLSMTKEFIWLMVFFVVFAFLGVGILLLLLGILGGLFKKSKFVDFMKKQMIWIVPILAGVAGGYIIYEYIAKEWLYFIVIPAVVVIIGEIIQYTQRDKEVVFHTYEDLIDLPILATEEISASANEKPIAKGE